MTCSTGVSEADADLQDLLHALPASASMPEVEGDKLASSSDEDTSDEAFAARHAALEAEEQQRFNSFAGKDVKISSNQSVFPFDVGKRSLWLVRFV